MARKCTGDGSKYVDLGPLNGIDISDPNTCLIVAGKTIMTPGTWPEGCLER